MLSRIAYFILYLFSFLPLTFLYAIFYPFYLVIHYIIKYRKQITLENLQLSFPQKSETEINKLYKQYHKHLTDLGAEMVKMLSMSNEEVAKRYVCKNPELVNQYFAQGRSVILMSSHYNNWEWMVLRVGKMFDYHGIGVGKPNTSKKFEQWINKRRTRFGTEVVFADTVRETFEKNLEENKLCAYMMLSDQSPSELKKSYLTTFLHQESCMIYGAEYFAKKYNFPVLYYEVIKKKRGYYEVVVSLITENPNEMQKGEIIDKYVKMLENTIEQKPEFWLWSHKRWKNRKHQIKKKLMLLPLYLLTFLPFFSFAQTEHTVIKDSVKTEMEVLRADVDNNMIKIKKLEKLKISGFIQAQMEIGQQFAITKVGQFTTYQENRDGKSGYFFRFGIRRGRIKIAWEESFGSAVFQLDITEKGIGVTDAYVKLSEPWLKVFSVTGGIFDRPFGDEMFYSSNRREVPEMTQLFQNLFPDERDLGFMLTIAAPKGSAPEGLKLDIGAFSGNGIRPDDNGKMDLIAHLKYDKKWAKYAFGIGTSVYYGTVNNSDTFIYKVEKVDNMMKWKKTQVDANSLNIRQYYGIDAQFSAKTKWGITNLRGEILFGTQPSQANSMMSPKANTYSNTATPAPSAFNYMRNFWGGHLYFVQDIYKTPLSLVLKYSYVDQNTKLKGNEIAKKTDLAYHTYGVGILYKITSYLRLMAFYDMPYNEKTSGIAVVAAPIPQLEALDYSKHVKANNFTLRLQFRF